MGFAFIFWVFAALFAGAAEGAAEISGGRVSLVVMILMWAAVAEIFSGLLYFGASHYRVNPGRMFKRPNGRAIFLPRLFVWPYLFFETVSYWLYRRRGAEPLWEEVGDGLFLGARLLPDDLPRLTAERITVVLDLVAEFSAPGNLTAHPSIVYRCLPALDGTALSADDLKWATEFVIRSLDEGHRVLVHCTFGHGRSASVVAAVLIKRGRAATLADALDSLQKLRRPIRLSREQRQSLQSPLF